MDSGRKTRGCLKRHRKRQIWIRLLLLVSACWSASFSFAPAQTAGVSDADQSATILACFHAGQTAVGDLHACARVWLTPEALVLCALRNTSGRQAEHIICPFIRDTADGRAALDVLLAQQGLTPASNLSIDARNLPNLPPPSAIDSCNTSGTTQQGFIGCIKNAMGAPREKLLDCVRNSRSDEDRALCAAESAPTDANLTTAVKCLGGQSARLDSFVACLVPERQSEAKKAIGCVGRYGGSPAALADCLAPNASAASKVLAACLAQSQNDNRNVVDCFSHFSPAFGRANQASACLSDPGNSRAKCATEFVGAAAVGKALAACANTPRPSLVSCLFDQVPDLRPEAASFQCMRYGGEGRSLVSNCAAGLVKDDKMRRTLACITGANNDPGALALCAADSVLSPRDAHAVNCSATTQGDPVAFALCAAAPATSDDWRISATCALRAAGDPKIYADCTAAPLELSELSKCFKGHFGKDCFGAENTIAKLLNGGQ